MVAESGPGLNRLLDDAMRAAGTRNPPQILLILAAHWPGVRAEYGDLAYGLVLKEAGGILQTAMLAATATGLASCPLGTGNSRLFSSLAQVNPTEITSVAEMTLGTLPP